MITCHLTATYPTDPETREYTLLDDIGNYMFVRGNPLTGLEWGGNIHAFPTFTNPRVAWDFALAHVEDDDES
jgi:hypothetical protein